MLLMEEQRLYFNPAECLKLRKLLNRLELCFEKDPGGGLNISILRNHLLEMTLFLAPASKTRQILGEILRLTESSPFDSTAETPCMALIKDLRAIYQLDSLRFRQ